MENKEELFNELKKLAKRANQRILRLERLTGQQGLFATKELYDYVSSYKVQGLSDTGRIRVSKKFNESQLIAMIKATEDFLDSKYSTEKQVKQLKSEIEQSLGFKIDYTTLSAMYQAQELWRWVKDNYDSDFWTEDAPMIFRMTKQDWVEDLATRINGLKDEEVINHLKAIYDYIKKHGLRGVVVID